MALFIVATPIGNLKDITQNALEVLSKSDFILCENTLITSKLLGQYNILNKKTLNYTDHTRDEEILEFLNLAKHHLVSLVSDAGTPVISDPGYKLIKKAHELEIKVHLIAGASSLIGGVAASGLPSYNFAFLGFYGREKQEKLNILLKQGITVAFFVPARDILKTLSDLETKFTNSKVCIAREMTKLFEDIKTDSIDNLKTYYGEEQKQKGEAVLVIAPDESLILDADIKKVLTKTMQEKPFLKDIRPKDLSEILKTYEEDFKHFSKKDIYNAILKKH